MDEAMLPSEPARSERPVLRATSPTDLLAVVPYHVGFHPAESLVVICVGRRRLGFTVRVDLPCLELMPVVADQISSALEQNDAETVVLVAYTSDAQRAVPLVEEMLDRFEEEGIDVLEAMRADGERWFSYTCEGACCPAEGTAYDNSCHPLTAQAVLEGEVALPDRATLESSVAAVGGVDAVSMTEAAARAEHDLMTRAEAGRSAETLAAELEVQMRAFVTRFLEDPWRLSDDESARAAVWAQFHSVRDVAWTMMSRPDAAVHLRLWQQVLRRVPPPYEPAVGSLTAFAAWLQGNGALAACAVERVLEVDSDYSMAVLIDQTLRNAIPPSTWDTITDDLRRSRLAG